jgi:hypothetical protein
MRLRSRIAWFAVGIFLSTVVSAYAQAKPAPPGPYPPPAPAYPRFEATGGYQLLKVPNQTIPFGLNVDGAWNRSKALGVVGEIGWATDSEAGFRVHAWNIGVGPRFNGRPTGGKVWPFAQVLVGMFNVRGGGFSDTSFQVQPGGGVNISGGDGWGVVFQGDYRRVFFEGEGENQGRFFAGIRVLLD